MTGNVPKNVNLEPLNFQIISEYTFKSEILNIDHRVKILNITSNRLNPFHIAYIWNNIKYIQSHKGITSRFSKQICFWHTCVFTLNIMVLTINF